MPSLGSNRNCWSSISSAEPEVIMASHKITPEERLLRLIESDEKPDGGETPAENHSKGKLGGWVKVFSRSPNASVRRTAWLQKMRPELNLRLVNRALIGVLLLVIIGIAYDINNSPSLPEDLKNPVIPVGTPVVNQGGADVKLASVSPLPEYLEEINKRDIFAPAPVAKPTPPKPELKPSTSISPSPPDPMQILQQKAKGLKLVGISWGSDPVAMIEDKASQQTSFLKVGDSINGLTVKAILKDRAILSHGDAEYDLF